MMKPALFITALVLTVAVFGGLYLAGPETKATNAPCATASAKGSSAVRACRYKRTNAFERVKGAVTDLHDSQRHHR